MSKPHPAIVSTLLLLVLALLLHACILPQSTRRQRLPVVEAKPDTLFGRYEMTLQDWDNRRTVHDLYCHFEYLEPIAVTTNKAEIPLLVIDSFCFIDSCMGAGACGWSKPEFDYILHSHPIRHTIGDDFDLIDQDGYFRPESYLLSTAGGAFSGCSQKELTLVLRARLYDRGTRMLIDQTVETIPLRVKRHRTVWY